MAEKITAEIQPRIGKYSAVVISSPPYKSDLVLPHKDAAEVARRINCAEQLAEACEEVLRVVDDAYKATGFIRFAKTSEQRMKIEAALAAYRKGEA